jgi:hypothetical protein
MNILTDRSKDTTRNEIGGALIAGLLLVHNYLGYQSIRQGKFDELTDDLIYFFFIISLLLGVYYDVTRTETYKLLFLSGGILVFALSYALEQNSYKIFMIFLCLALCVYSLLTSEGGF